MIENINMVVDILMRLLPWGIFIWVIFILQRHLTNMLFFPFYRYVRILLVNKDKKIVNPSEDYKILVNNKSIKYTWCEIAKFPGISIPVKKDKIVEIMVINNNVILEHKKVNPDMEVIQIEVDN